MNRHTETNVWHRPESYVPDLYGQLERSWAERGQLSGDARWARAADASHSSLLRVSTKGGIAIAVFVALYFIAEFLR
jgi:hypothetical protein